MLNISLGWVKSFDTFQMLVAVVVSSVAQNMASKSTILGLPDLASSSRVLQPEQNFFNHLFTVLWSTTLSSSVKQMFLVASLTLRPYSNC